MDLYTEELRMICDTAQASSSETRASGEPLLRTEALSLRYPVVVPLPRARGEWRRTATDARCVLWLQSVGLERYAALFEENDVDFDTLQLLTETDLEKIGVSLGHRRKLLDAIYTLRLTERPVLASLVQHPDSHVRVGDEAERRQITVVFCDLVGSTELARRLDPEDYRALTRRYQAVCTEQVARFEGHIAQYLGDGVLIYFGYPSAHEDDAQRAVRAALAIADEVALLNLPSGPLAVRVGVHTGVVVVGEVGTGRTREQLALGDTPNIAARLQSLAPSGGVILSERTRQLTARSFEYRDLGAHGLKGIDAPVQAWQVLAERDAATRLEAGRGGPSAPMVGRELEFAMLLHAWERAKSGRGQVVLLCGEPGIGKSRIWHALREKVSEEGASPWQYQCQQDFANSAFHLAIDYFRRALRFDREPSSEARLEKVHQMLQGYGTPQLDANLIGQLLSLPAEARYGALGMTPQRRKTETIRALNDVIAAAARRRPVLMMFEDLHWADPSSLESLEALRSRLDHLPLLLIATCRSEFRPAWVGQPGVTALTLGRLDAAQTRAIAARVAGSRSLPEALLEQIVAKTDGIPLFVEELTKAILESDLLASGDPDEAHSAQAEISIPSTLRDSLMARLDRLAFVKDIAQIGACIGREFSRELLARVAPVSADQLEQALERLVASELVVARGEAPELRYAFKHALIQEAAYDSLLKARRAHIHAQIAQALEQHFPHVKDNEAHLLAHHYSAAGFTEKAIDHWREAGEAARERLALHEAISHLTHGLELAATLPASRERDAKELALRTSLGTAWIALRGWAAPEARVNFACALPLVKALEQRSSYLQILYGLWVNDASRGRIAESMKWVRETEEAADRLEDADLRMLGHRLAQLSQLLGGDFLQAHRHGERVAALYDPDQGRHIEQLTNSDPLTLRGIWGAASLWILGFPERALALHAATEMHARARANPFGLGQLLTNGSCALDLLGATDRVLINAEEGTRLGQVHGIPLFATALGPLYAGVARVRAGQTVKGIAQLHEALASWRALGTHVVTPYWTSALAEGLATTGRIDEGLALIDSCLIQIEQPGCGERMLLAELLRLKGWMLELQGNLEQAETSLRSAVAVARQQHAKSWELRAVTTHARLLVAQSAREEARDLLAPVYAWFTEGFDTRDLRQAKALLEELG